MRFNRVPERVLVEILTAVHFSDVHFAGERNSSRSLGERFLLETRRFLGGEGGKWTGSGSSTDHFTNLAHDLVAEMPLSGFVMLVSLCLREKTPAKNAMLASSVFVKQEGRINFSSRASDAHLMIDMTHLTEKYRRR